MCFSYSEFSIFLHIYDLINKSYIYLDVDLINEPCKKKAPEQDVQKGIVPFPHKK